MHKLTNYNFYYRNIPSIEMVDVIDKNGYRANVGIVLMNQHKELFFAKRQYQSGWQFPKGASNLVKHLRMPCTESYWKK
ncbi:MAG: hypothetical protein Ct9H300mP4_02990 [Gammaproteobacteria bacterium]|nr:MAG: hypothetical protein Ct9H300mP4_02990 [Gammaproteobacteria bacterium]